LPNFTLATSRLPQKTSSLRRRYKQHPTGKTALRRHESPTKFLKQPFQGRKNSPNQPFSFQKNRLRQPDQPRPLPNFTLATSRLPQKTSSLRRRYQQHPTGKTALRRHESPIKFLKQPFQGRRLVPINHFRSKKIPVVPINHFRSKKIPVVPINHFRSKKSRSREPDQPRPLPNFTLATSRLPQKTSSLRRRYESSQIKARRRHSDCTFDLSFQMNEQILLGCIINVNMTFSVGRNS
jgi:hypothetical protein